MWELQTFKNSPIFAHPVYMSESLHNCRPAFHIIGLCVYVYPYKQWRNKVRKYTRSQYIKNKMYDQLDNYKQKYQQFLFLNQQMAGASTQC